MLASTSFLFFIFSNKFFVAHSHENCAFILCSSLTDWQLPLHRYQRAPLARSPVTGRRRADVGVAPCFFSVKWNGGELVP
uniref:Putative secreted protein n=1 Tax=Anopheles triannulatus TaxID=58253 RepID=A0A2M4B7M0_9DIPT